MQPHTALHNAELEQFAAAYTHKVVFENIGDHQFHTGFGRQN